MSMAGAFLFIVNQAKRKGGAVHATPERDWQETPGKADVASRSDDDARLSAILEASGGTTSHLGTLLYDYYRDKVRADRTSRELLYLHLALAIGALRRTSEEQQMLEKGGA